MLIAFAAALLRWGWHPAVVLAMAAGLALIAALAAGGRRVALADRLRRLAHAVETSAVETSADDSEPPARRPGRMG